MNLLAELRRRNVLRMAGLYLVGAWLIVQVTGTVSPMLGAPEWVGRTVLALLAIGFVPALVFAWVFEMTPEGLKRDAEVPAGASIAPQTARRMDRMIIVVLALALGYFAVDEFVLEPRRDASTKAVATMTGEASPAPSNTASRDDAAYAAPGATSLGADPKSIAVLAFSNLSTDVENGFFAEGVSEELLNVLAGVEGLRVASRTSAFSFRGKNVPIPDIARQLGVAHVLEGSVRRQGQRVRITAQLIDARRDVHLWSETYDRDLTDIFKVQEEIAQAITGELEGILGKRQVAVAASTDNLDAYQDFLRGRARFQRRDELPQAIEDLRRAVALDADFGEAWIYLAATWMVAPGYFSPDRVDHVQAKVEARAALDRAAVLAPEHPMLLALEGFLRGLEVDQIGALALLERASAASMNDSTPLIWRGMLLLQTGYVDEAIGVLGQAQRMDPLSGIANGYLAIAYLSAGREAEAEASARRAEALGWDPAVFVLAYDLASRGERARALALWDEFIPQPRSELEARRNPLVRRLLADPNDTEARATLGTLPLEGALEHLVAIRDYDTLLDLAEEQVRQRAVYRRLSFWVRMAWLPSTLELRESPRFLAYSGSNGVAALWEARGYPDGCVRIEARGGDHLDCKAGR